MNRGLPLVPLFLQETNQQLLSPINETHGIDLKWQVIDTGREESPSTGSPLTSMLQEKLGTNMRSAVTSTVIAFQSAEKRNMLLGFRCEQSSAFQLNAFPKTHGFNKSNPFAGMGIVCKMLFYKSHHPIKKKKE